MLSYTNFFLGSTGVAGALTGLLFVSPVDHAGAADG
jgi:hypothetical protein